MLTGKMILLGIIGLAGGITVAGGVFAFISILQMLPRLAACMRDASRTYQMETGIFLGGTTGCILTVFFPSLALGSVGLAAFGLFAGIYIGCLSMALAETLKVFPVLIQRTKMCMGLPWLVVSMALGKAFGCLYQMFFMFDWR